MQLLFIRHGETDWNVQGRCQGHSDIPLNQSGRNQAIMLYEQLKDVPLDAIYSSDLMRAIQTIEKVATAKGLPIHQSAALRERNYGQWEGQVLSKLLIKYSEDYRFLQVGGKYGIEHTVDLQKRMVHFISKLVARHSSETVAIVSHGAAISACISKLTNGMTQLTVNSIEHASVIVVSIDEELKWKVHNS